MRKTIFTILFLAPLMSFSQNIDVVGLWYIGAKDSNNDLEIAKEYILYPDTSNHSSIDSNMWIMERLTFNEDSTFTLLAEGTPQNPYYDFPTLRYFNSGKWEKLGKKKIALIVKHGVYDFYKYIYSLHYDNQHRLVFTLIDEELIKK